MKKRLAVIALLLCMAFVMASMAYTAATVTNVAALKIVNTNEALISLEDNTPWSWQSKVGAKDKTAVVENGELVIRFGRGVDRDGITPKFYGLQPNSSYEWSPLFTMRNKSAETIEVTVSIDAAYASYVTFGTMGATGVTATTWGVQGQPLVFSSIPPESGSGMQNIRNICVKIDIPTGVTVSQSELTGAIIVSAKAK